MNDVHNRVRSGSYLHTVLLLDGNSHQVGDNLGRRNLLRPCINFDVTNLFVNNRR